MRKGCRSTLEQTWIRPFNFRRAATGTDAANDDGDDVAVVANATAAALAPRPDADPLLPLLLLLDDGPVDDVDAYVCINHKRQQTIVGRRKQRRK
jgi:hypothetical protein